MWSDSDATTDFSPVAFSSLEDDSALLQQADGYKSQTIMRVYSLFMVLALLGMFGGLLYLKEKKEDYVLHLLQFEDDEEETEVSP
mmetsp:Transcript_20815/g.32123  ORF Transcript_20815/g.32123 Transcript_20815/m.32123 type:complete len:85 (+) Transcript_20815:3097-3351(+)